jgi:hypothetical protein
MGQYMTMVIFEGFEISGWNGLSTKQQQAFIELLERNDIEYETDSDNPLSDMYIVVKELYSDSEKGGGYLIAELNKEWHVSNKNAVTQKWKAYNRLMSDSLGDSGTFLENKLTIVCRTAMG